MADEIMDGIISRVGKNEAVVTSIGGRLATTETDVTSVRHRVGTTETDITSIRKGMQTTETAMGGRLVTTETSIRDAMRINHKQVISIDVKVEANKNEITEIKRVNATETLVIKYGEDKKVLIKARDEVVEIHGKLHDQLNSIHTSFLYLLGILLTFTVLFYSYTYTSSPGTKMMVLVVANSVVICIFVLLVKEKIESIKEQMHALDKWFSELECRFKGLSMSGLARGMKLHALEMKDPRACEELYCHYKWASEYDILGEDKRIPGMEVEEFSRSEWRRSSSTTYSNWYLVAVIIFTIISAILCWSQ